MEPSIDFSWTPSSNDYSCKRMNNPSSSNTTTNTNPTIWKFTFIENFSLTSINNLPCFINVSIPNGRIVLMEIISNSKNLESYSKESKQCLGGGELKPDWEYCETLKALPIPQTLKEEENKTIPPKLKCTGKIPPSRFQSSINKKHSIRFKLLSIKPNKLHVTLSSVIIIVNGDDVVNNAVSNQTVNSTTNEQSETSNSASTTKENNTNSNSENNSTSGGIGGGSNGAGPNTQGDAQVPSITNETLRNMMTTAMFAIESKISIACSNLESGIDKKLIRLNENVLNLKTQINVIQEKVENHILFQNNNMKKSEEELETSTQPTKLGYIGTMNNNEDLLMKGMSYNEANNVDTHTMIETDTKNDIETTKNGNDIEVENENIKNEITNEMSGDVKNVIEWNHKEVITWLENNGFQQYITSLELIGVLENGETLLQLTYDDLISEELGISEDDVLKLVSCLVKLSPSSRCSDQPRFQIPTE